MDSVAGKLINGATGQGSEGTECMKNVAEWWRIERNGWRGKWDQLSKTSSSREKCQINSRRMEFPIIIGPQQRLHLGMAASFRRCQEPQTSEHADQSFIHWADPKTYSATCSCFDLCNWNEMKIKLLKRDAHNAELIRFPTYLPYATDIL